MKRRHLVIGILILGLALTAVPGPLAVQAANPARPRANFNGDWYADLAVGVPWEDVETYIYLPLILKN